MVIGMLLALTACPAMLGTQEAIRQSQSKTRREEHRGQRCNMIVSCVQSSTRSKEVNNRIVVLRDNKLYIETGAEPDDISGDRQPIPGSHPFCGYFLPYPDSDYEGLVSTITHVAPILNWIYIDKSTYEVKYGVRDFAQPNFTGPFDCTRQDRRMTFETWEGFLAVEENPGVWALYFDRDDDGLRSKFPPTTRVLEIELIRRERKVEKPAEDAAKTLDEMMKQQQQKQPENPEMAQPQKLSTHIETR
ncbi:hypothetical protein BKA67DRAFT_693012 [Truncatella angustata]|uniref:Uncharacterized protein n=1 Tax=Truncatella angustata TaxID=152316 RepID=A0A9P8UGK9_9PEZI|nr:uncharacterized protein BKA67DRAFT_693012 [Truncatella angustata]KAH6651758.1 hypothetical protein BKA67DRAFT_693012 [Truncatella angustata]